MFSGGSKIGAEIVFYRCQRHRRDAAYAPMPPSTSPGARDELSPVPVNLLLPRRMSGGRHTPVPSTMSDPYGLTADTAAQVVLRYTRPGDVVAVLDDSCHVRRAVTGHDRRLVTLFTRGDRGDVRVVMATIPRIGHAAWPLASLVTWMSACHDRLAPGGFLIACVSAEGADGRYADHASDVLAAAASVGLTYQQHLLAVHAPLPDDDPRARSRYTGDRPVLFRRRHPRAHSDLFVARKVTIDA